MEPKNAYEEVLDLLPEKCITNLRDSLSNGQYDDREFYHLHGFIERVSETSFYFDIPKVQRACDSLLAAAEELYDFLVSHYFRLGGSASYGLYPELKERKYAYQPEHGEPKSWQEMRDIGLQKARQLHEQYVAFVEAYRHKDEPDRDKGKQELVWDELSFDKETGKAICKQKPITLEKFEEQVDLELEKYTIHPKFLQWALEIIDRRNDEEIKERTTIYEAQQKAYNDNQKQIDNLTKMLMRELIDEDEFKKQRTELEKEQAKLKRNLESTEIRAKKWLELTEQTFHFAHYARKAYLKGGVQKKREIFAALGQNYVLKDGKVSIEANKWLVPIEKAYPELEAEFKRIELDKNLDTQGRNERFASLILTWGG